MTARCDAARPGFPPLITSLRRGRGGTSDARSLEGPRILMSFMIDFEPMG